MFDDDLKSLIPGFELLCVQHYLLAYVNAVLCYVVLSYAVFGKCCKGVSGRESSLCCTAALWTYLGMEPP